jgi:GT2 family glycosyltransferase
VAPADRYVREYRLITIQFKPIASRLLDWSAPAACISRFDSCLCGVMGNATGRLAAPLVSVVMPTFNRADLIVHAVQSVIDQSFADWELLIVDDGSTDATTERVEALDDPRIVLLRQGRIGNVARLRNMGVAAARGDYIAFVDSDDLWVPSKLDLQLRALSDKPGAWCYGDHALADADGVEMPLRAGRFSPISGHIARRLLAQETGAAMITWLVPRSLFDRVGGFDETLHLGEDLDLALRLGEAAEAVALPMILALTREHPGRKTKGAADVHRQTAIIFEKAAARAGDATLRRLAGRRRARHLASAGETLIEQGKFAAGGSLLAQALVGGAGLRRSARGFAAGLWRRLAKRSSSV